MTNHTLVDIDDAKHLIFYVIRKYTSNKKVEKKLLKQYTADFDKILNEIKNTSNEEPITSVYFKYDNLKVYLIEDQMTNFTVEEEIENLKIMLDCLLNDLSALLYREGYQFILSRLNEFRFGGGLNFDFIPIFFSLGIKYGKKLDNSLNLLDSYCRLLENSKNFHFNEWDTERTLQTYRDITLEARNESILFKYGEAYKSDINAMRFFDDYFKLSIKLTKNACNELLKIIKDNNIKFN